MIVKSDTIKWNEFEFDIYEMFRAKKILFFFLQQEVMTLSILEKWNLMQIYIGHFKVICRKIF